MNAHQIAAKLSASDHDHDYFIATWIFGPNKDFVTNDKELLLGCIKGATYRNGKRLGS